MGSSPWGGKESDTTEGTEHEHAVSGNFFSSQFPHHPLFIFRANNFQSPLHLDVTMTLSSGQWNVGGSDVCQFTEWPVSVVQSDRLFQHLQILEKQEDAGA